MIEVLLELLDGSIVARIHVPRFLRQPEVIVWGDRVFALRYPQTEIVRYREVFAYWAPRLEAKT